MPRENNAVAQFLLVLGLYFGGGVVTGLAHARPAPPPVVSITTKYDFATLVGRVEAEIAASNMILVAKASASAAAEKRGVKIPADTVIMVFRNDYAVRMLQASQRAGIEAPIPIHVFETPNGQAGLAYRRPTAAFRRYGDRALNEMAKELDAVFAQIARQASGG